MNGFLLQGRVYQSVVVLKVISKDVQPQSKPLGARCFVLSWPLIPQFVSKAGAVSLSYMQLNGLVFTHVYLNGIICS